jgi:hypothetical protein
MTILEISALKIESRGFELHSARKSDKSNTKLVENLRDTNEKQIANDKTSHEIRLRLKLG